MNDLVNGSFVSLEESKLQNTCCENVLEMDGKAFTYRAQFCLQKDPFEFCELCNQHIFFALVIFINLSVFFQPIYSFKKNRSILFHFCSIFGPFLVHFRSFSGPLGFLVYVFLYSWAILKNFWIIFCPFLIHFWSISTYFVTTRFLNVPLWNGQNKKESHLRHSLLEWRKVAKYDKHYLRSTSKEANFPPRTNSENSMSFFKIADELSFVAGTFKVVAWVVAVVVEV